MKLPDFLIIGAMKAGTTSLYRDLLTNSDVFMPVDKEPGNLARDDVCHLGGRRQYAALFDTAGRYQVCGEASTVYSQLPDIGGVAERARKILGDRFKVIYLVREPVSHIISHHHHLWTAGNITCGIDQAVRNFPRFVNYSRYAMQIAPWLELVGSDRVFIVPFKTYIHDRRLTVASVSRFLGIEPRGDLIRPDVVYNRSVGKPVTKGLVHYLRHNPLYRDFLRAMVPRQIRDKLWHVLSPKARTRPDPPSLDTVRYIIEQVCEDADRLRIIMGRDEPLWDFQEVLRYHEAP